MQHGIQISENLVVGIEFEKCSGAVCMAMLLPQAQDICAGCHSCLYAIRRVLDDESLFRRRTKTLEGKIVDSWVGLRGMAFIEPRSDNVHISGKAALVQCPPDVGKVA